VTHVPANQSVKSWLSYSSLFHKSVCHTGLGEQEDPIQDDERAKHGAGHTSLTSLRPEVLISVSNSAHSITSPPAVPAKANVSFYSPCSIVEGDVPTNWIGCEGLPPKTAILVWCRSNMAVVNMAQVDAQLPLPTANNQPDGVYGENQTFSLMATLLQGQILVSETERGESAALT